MKQWILTLGLGFLLGVTPGCNSSLSPGAPGELSVVSGAPEWPEPPGTINYSVPAKITAITDDNGTLIVGTESGVYRMTASGPTAMEPFVESDSPTTTGAVRALAQRASGVMVAAEHGLFHSYEQQLLFSPVNEIVENMTINDLSLSGEANNEKLWLAASDGLFLVSDKSFDQISFGSEQGTPISVASSTSMAVVSFGSAVYELDIAPWAYSIAPSGLGNVVGVEVVDNIFYLASDRGLIRREANGAYTLFTMSNNGNEPVVAVGGNDSSGLFALTGAGLASVNENTATGIAPLTSMPTQPLVAADGYGNAWVANGTQLTNVMVGHSVSFEAKVATILETNCNTCHITGYDAPVHDFANYDEAVALAETIIQRVSLGQMPPPPMPALSTEDFDTLVSWYATGMNP